ADRLVLLVDEDGRVAVELDVAAVGPRELAPGPHDHRARDLALLDLGARDRLADRDDDDIADRRVAPARAAEHLDAVHLLGAAVVRDVEDRGHLDHDAPSTARDTVRSRRHRLVRDIGRDSTISTTSPTLPVLFSSCTWYFTRLVRNLWNRRSRTRRMTVTVTVLSMTVDVMVPMMVRREPRASLPASPGEPLLSVVSLMTSPSWSSSPHRPRPAPAPPASAPGPRSPGPGPGGSSGSARCRAAWSGSPPST